MRLIPGGNGAVEINADDGIVGRFHNRRQTLRMAPRKRVDGGPKALLQLGGQAAE